MAIASPAKLRARAMESNRTRAFLLLLACEVVAVAVLVEAVGAGPIVVLAVVFGVAVASAFLNVPFRLYVRRRDVAMLDVWLASLPFPVEGFLETLGAEGTIGEAHVTLQFASQPPTEDRIAALLESSAALGRAHVGSTSDAIEIHVHVTDELPDLVNREDGNLPPNEVAVVLRAIFQDVCLPLHESYPIARVRVSHTERP